MFDPPLGLGLARAMGGHGCSPGPQADGAAICSECVHLCVEIIREKSDEQGLPSAGAALLGWVE